MLVRFGGGVEINMCFIPCLLEISMSIVRKCSTQERLVCSIFFFTTIYRTEVKIIFDKKRE